MSRSRKRLLIAGLSLLGLTVAALIVGIQVVQTDWFRDYVKRKIVAATEDATGGKVELGSFTFEWKHLRVIVTDFVIHGTEPRDAAPLLLVPRVEVDIRPFTSIHHLLDVTYLGIDRPEANIVILADGRNNLPQPKSSVSTDEQPLQSIVNAAIGHFDLNNATIAFADAKQTLSLHANNFRAQLWFNVLQQGYRGELFFQPIYVTAGRNRPVVVNVTLPVSIEKNSVAVDGATVATASSNLRISGTVDNLVNPKFTARVLGQIALVDLRDFGNLPLTLGTRGMPSAIDLDANASVSSKSIQVARLQLKLGASSVEASGTLKDPQAESSLRFDTQIALGEIGRLLDIEQNPLGTVAFKGTAKLDAANNYDVNGDLTAQKVSFEAGKRRIPNLDVTSVVHLDPHAISLNKLRVNALGGTLEGDASLQDFARYQFHGDLKDFPLRSVAGIAGEPNLPYAGSIQGPITLSGDRTAPDSLNAAIALAIAPGKKGIPVSGRLNVSYLTASNDLQVKDSYIALPHSRLTADGAALRQLNVALTTTDLSDFAGAIGNGVSAVNLQGHRAEFTGTVTGGMAAPRVACRLRANGFSIQSRMFDTLTVDATASDNGAAVQQAMVTRGPMQIEFTGRVGMNQWKITPQVPIDVQSTIRNGDLADVTALAGQPAAGASGALEARVQVSGTVGDPTGSVNLTATNGTVRGEPFNGIQAQVNLTDQLIAIPSATADRGNSHIAIAAEYHHSRNSVTTGQLHARVQGNQVDLAQIQALQRLRSGAGGTLDLSADVMAVIDSPKFQLVNGTASVSARGLKFDSQNFGDATLDARSAGQAVRYQLVSTFAGSNIRVTGNTDLQPDYKTSLDANISNLPIERALAAAQRTDVPAKGTLSATAHFSGTKGEPTGSIDLNLTKAVLYQEPVDRLRVRASYETQRAVLEQFEIAAPGAQLALTAEFEHPKDNLQAGRIRFHLNDSRIDLARVHTIQANRPGLSGIVQMGGDGAAELRASLPRVSFETLKADISAKQISARGKNLGDATLTADAQNNNVNFTLTSNLAGASIRGSGRAQMSAEYPLDAHVSFSNANWANLQPLFGSRDTGGSSFNAGADGELTIQGPVLKTDQLSGSLRLTRVEVTPTAPSHSIQGNAPPLQMAIKNAEPVSVTVNSGNLRIDSAHLTGPQTDIQAKGSLSLKDRSMNLSLDANANLALLQTLDRDFSSSGNLTLATTVRGTLAKPAVSGTVQLKNASVNYHRFPNGISNANGTVEFSGTTASLRNLTADTGGGKVTLTGFVLFSDSPRFGLRASASNVRIDVQQGVSVVTNANLNLTGTEAASTLSGNAVIARINYAPRTDLGSILARAAPPVQGSTSPSLLDNMKLDVQVATSDALAVHSALAQGLEGNANLRVQGTASQPSVLGRVTMTSGTLTFFGNSYTVNSGTISFYNPVRIEPILDASLETMAEGVDVTLHVTGPIDNLQLSYTSDPPLQFEEIIALLATGKTPTTDPTLLANNPPPQQGITQMGESAVLAQAVANPVAGRLERVFGVTQLKINPEFTNGSSTPQTTLTLQQQVTRNVTFTYITQVDNANAETIRAEITLNPLWSAAAMRDENGIFSLNLFYKRQFR